MSGYLQSLVGRARGAPPAIRPVRQLRFPAGAVVEQPAAAEPAPRRSAPPPADTTSRVQARAQAGPAVETPVSISATDPLPRDAALPATSQTVPVAAAGKVPAIQPHLPVQREEAPGPRAAPQRVDVQRFVSWLEAEPAPQETMPSTGEAPIAVTPRAARAEPVSRVARQGEAAPPHLPDTHIHIGRVELVSMAPSPVRTGRSTAKPALSLEDYLRRRDGKA